jgi:hypothetical protein
MGYQRLDYQCLVDQINMKEAFRATIKIATEWQNIGTLLNIPPDTLNTIDRGNGTGIQI